MTKRLRKVRRLKQQQLEKVTIINDALKATGDDISQDRSFRDTARRDVIANVKFGAYVH